MEQLIRVLRDKGFKITPQRRAVITALAKCGKFPTAQRIWDYVRTITPDVSFDTIYRNLSLLVELGIVSEIHTKGREGNVFEIVETDHHHHLICVSCGTTQCLDFCPVSHGDLAKAEAGGFKITSHSLEFYGYCRECASAG
ncbi:transcriptional repressor|uniref:Fur family transcriptional regulator, zinc uptake regulator n=1 Tax=Dendrosporobacter quercicolus TaxID=146817 RepID=A0A1G9N903_9FIRM|nr:Fur family transcriptional regulator [Dendrosporobacter quercicolus]NSL47253.1 transcriptional repressor [Dendrosporobacter quercicolus DSM 1736]SDL82365.1 Fur family transcriptional regulator, zinc uptake regulator [Dendrosporobacter quercicolus]